METDAAANFQAEADAPPPFFSPSRRAHPRVVPANGFFAVRVSPLPSSRFSVSLVRSLSLFFSRPSRFPDTDLSQFSNYVALSKVAAEREREALNCLYIHPIAPADSSSLVHIYAWSRADLRSLRARAWARTLSSSAVYIRGVPVLVASHLVYGSLGRFGVDLSLTLAGKEVRRVSSG